MFHEKILVYLDKRLSGIRENYDLAREKVDAEAVHDLRVHLKRARALFSLIEALEPGFNARREFRPFKELSRATRRLRDIQVQIELFDHSTRRLKNKPDGFRRFLELLEDRLKREFTVSSGPQVMQILQSGRDSLEEALSGISAAASLPRAEARYHQLKAEFLDLACLAEKDDSVLHELRTRAKQTHYTFEITRICFRRLGGERRFVGRVKRLHGLLGDWHDREVAFEHLDRYLHHSGARGLDRSLGALGEILSRDKERLAGRCRVEISRLRAMLTPGANSTGKKGSGAAVNGGREPAATVTKQKNAV